MKAIAMEYPEAWTAVSGSSAEAFEHDARMRRRSNSLKWAV